MIQNYRIITLCGSTRFKEQFLQEQKRLTLEGNIVLTVGLFGHSGDEEVWKPGMKAMLDDMHLRKIDLSDEVFIINVGGYIGESTLREIAYAEKTGKIVRYLDSTGNRYFHMSIFDDRDCPFTARQLNCLRGEDIETYGELALYDRKKLLRHRNFGRKSLVELEEYLRRTGLV